jgi:SAM-dependent MidA family methyltransferase
MPEGPPPLDAEEAARTGRVRDRLLEAAGDTGVLPLDRFMEIALYGPQIGFYERERPLLGPEGDFYTAAHVTPLFARTVAARIREVRHTIGNPRTFWIVELGPGDGTLAEGLLSELAADPTGVQYILVERAPARRREVATRLGEGRGNIRVRHADHLGDLGPFTGVVLANEFLDAQPARRLVWRSSAWHEGGVRLRSSGAELAELPLTRPVPGRALPVAHEEPLTMEFSPSAEASVREVADHLEAGAAIFFDYGMEETELLRAHPQGTLAAVRRHRFLADPFDSPGTADLSTFVNFTRIRDAARSSGLVEVAYRTQAEALGAWGYPKVFDAGLRAAPNGEEKVRLTLASKNLLFGFDRFRVLELAPTASADVLRA